MYTEKDTKINNRSLFVNIIIVLILFTICLSSLILALILRKKLPFFVITITFSLLIVTYWDFRIEPLLKYKRFLSSCRSGLRKNNKGTLTFIDTNYATKNGIKLIAINLIENDSKLILYYDIQKGKPPMIPGEDYEVESFSNIITNIGHIT